MESYAVMMACDPNTIGMVRTGPTFDNPGAPARRIEEWIVSTLEDSPLPSAVRARKRAARRESENAGWTHIRVVDCDGIAVVILLDRAIVGELDLQAIGGELRALVASGSNRVVLDFDLVERCSSHFPGIVARLSDACKAAGGLLKIGAVRSPLADLFSLPGLTWPLAIYPDAATAVASEWPERPPLALRVGILAALKGKSDAAPDGTGGPTDERGGSRSAVSRPNGAGLPGAPAVIPPRVRLIVLNGRAEGRAIAVRGPRFVIGRDPVCQLRPQSPAIGRFHTTIESRGGQVFIRDLGRTNPTLINGEYLQNATVEVFDGTQLQVGPLQFVIRIEADQSGETITTDDLIARWVLEAEHRDGARLAPNRFERVPDDEKESEPQLARHAVEGEIGTESVKCERIEDILIVTLMMPNLDSQTEIGQLRDALNWLYEHTPLRRVVISLCNITFLPSAAVGVLVAHMLRLEWSGGGLRLCHVLPPVMTVMNNIHLPMLVDTYPTLDEAVLASWK